MSPSLLPHFSPMLPLLLSLGFIAVFAFFSPHGACAASGGILGFRDGVFGEEEVLREGQAAAGIFGFRDDIFEEKEIGMDGKTAQPAPRSRRTALATDSPAGEGSNLVKPRSGRESARPIAPILLSMNRPRLGGKAFAPTLFSGAGKALTPTPLPEGEGLKIPGSLSKEDGLGRSGGPASGFLAATGNALTPTPLPEGEGLKTPGSLSKEEGLGRSGGLASGLLAATGNALTPTPLPEGEGLKTPGSLSKEEGLERTDGFLLAQAPGLQSLSDQDLGDVTAGSIVDFSMVDNVARMNLDLYLETHMEIEKIRAGYHHHNETATTGWDQSWNNVTFGSASEYFKAYGLTFVTEYEGTGSDRKVARILFGSPQVQGTMSADFTSFSGVVDPSVCSTGTTTNPYRSSLGQKTFTFQGADKGLFLGLTLTGTQPGFAVFAGKPLDGDSGILKAGRADWWDAPAGSLAP